MPLPPPNDSPTLADLVNDAIALALYRLRTNQPAHIVSYDPATNTAMVQPSVMEADYDENGERIVVAHPPVPGVPVAFVGNEDFWISHPLKKGTPGLLISCSASLDAWSATNSGTVIDPKNDQKHHLSDSIFIPGVRPPKSPIGGAGGPPTDAMVINGAKILMGSKNANDPIVTMSVLTKLYQLINTTADSAGANAALAAKLLAASWPNAFVSTKLKGE